MLYIPVFTEGEVGVVLRGFIYSMWSNFWFLNLVERKRANTGIKRHLSNGPPVENDATHAQ